MFPLTLTVLKRDLLYPRFSSLTIKDCWKKKGEHANIRVPFVVVSGVELIWFRVRHAAGDFGFRVVSDPGFRYVPVGFGRGGQGFGALRETFTLFAEHPYCFTGL